MATNSSWCLERLGEQNTMHILKIGETKIGRRKNSDIKVASLICSRWHCSITVDADNKVSVEDRVRKIQFRFLGFINNLN